MNQLTRGRLEESEAGLNGSESINGTEVALVL